MTENAGRVDLLKYAGEDKSRTSCPICEHEDREGIELLGMISCASWNICRDRINNAFGTRFSARAVQTHMTRHQLHQTSVEQGVILDAMRGEDGAPSRISVDTMLQTLLIQGMLDLAKGRIRCKTPAELINVATTLQNVQREREAKMSLDSGDAKGFYNVMAAYGAAIKDTVSPEQLRSIVAKANSLGTALNIGEIPLEEPVDVEPQQIMAHAVEDYKRLGRGRTREELVDAGVLDGLEDEVDLPD